MPITKKQITTVDTESTSSSANSATMNVKEKKSKSSNSNSKKQHHHNRDSLLQRSSTSKPQYRGGERGLPPPAVVKTKSPLLDSTDGKSDVHSDTTTSADNHDTDMEDRRESLKKSKIPSEVIRNVTKDLKSRRLVEYFVVFSCKPRLRKKRQENGTEVIDMKSADDMLVSHTSSDGKDDNKQNEEEKSTIESTAKTSSEKEKKNKKTKKTKVRRNSKDSFPDISSKSGADLNTSFQDMHSKMKPPLPPPPDTTPITTSKERYGTTGGCPVTPTKEKKANDESRNDRGEQEEALTPSRVRALDADDDDDDEQEDNQDKLNHSSSLVFSEDDVVDGQTSQRDTDSQSQQSSQHRGASSNIHMPNADEQDESDEKVNKNLPYFVPIQTSRYPLDDHDDNPLNPMLPHFCFPVKQTIELTSEYQMPRIHHFVLTNDKGSKVYGTCLTIYEEFHPRFEIPNNEEEKEAYALFRTKGGLVHDDAPTDEGDIEVTLTNKPETKTVFIPKVLCLLSTWPYLQAFREYISQLYRLATMTDQMKAPLERYILNICEEIPAPPPGSFEIRLKILTSTIRFWAPPANQPIPYVALPFEALFECLDATNVMYVWYALAIEQKVLLVSSQHSLLTICAEILCSLLFPMQWSYVYIPILPRFLTPMLDAPMPYLCGVVRENFATAMADISDETIVVDLDQNSVRVGRNAPRPPPMPFKRKLKLESALNKHVKDIFWRARGLHREDVEEAKPVAQAVQTIERSERIWNEKLKTYDDAFNIAYAPNSHTLQNEGPDKNDNGQKQSRWDAVQEAFLRFFVSILVDYKRFMATTSTTKSTPPSSSPWSNNITFQMNEFIAAQRSDFRPFLTVFCRTQLFDDFITKRMYSPDEPDCTFFDQSIAAKVNRSKMTFKKKDSSFVYSAKAHKVLKTIDAIEPNVEKEETTSSYNLLDQLFAPAEPEDEVFFYKQWPESFDPSLFGEARAIPDIIAAEFDRRAALALRLSENYVDLPETDFEVGDCHPSLEVATFTVFFVVYCDIVGREFESMRNKFKKDVGSKKGSEPPAASAAAGIKPATDVVEEEKSGSSYSMNLCAAGGKGICSRSSTVDTSTTVTISTATNNTSINNFDQNLKKHSEKVAAALEEANLVSTAQLDLAFSSLRTLSLRKLFADPDAYGSLMEACGRCGSTDKATTLVRMMRENGIIVDSEMYSKYLVAFTVADDISPDEPIKSPLAKVPSGSLDNVLETVKSKKKKTPSFRKKSTSRSHSSAQSPQSSSLNMSSSHGSWSLASSSIYEGEPAIITSNSMTSKSSRAFKKTKKLKSLNELKTTDQLEKHFAIGESLLQFLYNDLKIDTNSDTCTKCSRVISEDEIMVGWSACSFSDYTTKCPQCKHRFVPRFSVTTTTSTFMGSQGKGTPLYCEFLSPWVLRKELHNAINNMEEGYSALVNPDWRSGTNIDSTLWWNLIVSFRRHKLPTTFLLQGSFRNRLIMPMPDA